MIFDNQVPNYSCIPAGNPRSNANTFVSRRSASPRSSCMLPPLPPPIERWLSHGASVLKIRRRSFHIWPFGYHIIPPEVEKKSSGGNETLRETPGWNFIYILQGTLKYRPPRRTSTINIEPWSFHTYLAHQHRLTCSDCLIYVSLTPRRVTLSHVSKSDGQVELRYQSSRVSLIRQSRLVSFHVTCHGLCPPNLLSATG